MYNRWSVAVKALSSFRLCSVGLALDARVSPTFSPLGYATSRQGPENHFLEYPNGICRMPPEVNSVDKVYKNYDNVPRAIEKN